MKEIKIKQVKNGFIITLICQELGAFKEPYQREVYVFEGETAMLTFVKKFFE